MQEVYRRGQGMRRNVLLVDDDQVSRQIMANIIGRDHDVFHASNGQEALDVLRDHGQRLSLVLLDLLMPVMGGYEVLRTLQADPLLRRIPVIVLTSENVAEVESLQLGAVDFIPKPYVPEVVAARVNRAIELAEDRQIIRETERDALTGLYTHDFFLQYARLRDRYESGQSMDAVVININRFHLINELYGRSLGDRLLRSVADVIGRFQGEKEGLACRSGSDNFCLYLHHREDYESSLLPALASLGERLGSKKITVRVGIYPQVDSSVSLEQRFDRAGAACGRLRGRYATECAYYDNALHEKELHDGRLLSEMDSALSSGQFRVVFQPKYHIQGARPVLSSAEALVRWFHPVHGAISPSEFIPLFEDNGLISRLDHFVWTQAAAQIRSWRDRFGFSLPVSVNVSRVDLFHPDLESRLQEVLRLNGLSPSDLLLEITESAYTNQRFNLVETVGRLREAGFRVEMDDFGSGYSSLNMLTSLPMDALKLDMGFIHNIASSEKDLHIVKLMLEIARFLSVPVIAEGVETEQQYALLKDAGCDIIQGFYFSRPLPPEEFDRLIERELAARR